MDSMSDKNNSRIFKNPLLERLTYGYPTALIVVYVPILIYFSYVSIHSGLLKFFLELAIGMFIWTFVEYILHRFAFHYPAKSARGQRFVYLLHERHHVFPRDPMRTVTSPIISFPVAVIFYFIYRAIFGAETPGLYAGTLLVYVGYELVHYSVHRFNFKNDTFKYLKRHHFAHHFLDNKHFFGVTSPLWDIVFKTKPSIPQTRNADVIKWSNNYE